MPTVTMNQILIYFLAFVATTSGAISGTTSLRTLCPLNEACILVAALFKSGSDKSMSTSSGSCRKKKIELFSALSQVK